MSAAAIVVSSSTDSDSDLEGLVDVVVTKTKSDLSCIRQSYSKTNQQRNLSKSTPSATTTTRRTRSSTRTLSHSDLEDVPDTDTKTELGENLSDLAVFIDTSPAMTYLTAKNASCHSTSRDLVTERDKDAGHGKSNGDKGVVKWCPSAVLGQSVDDDSSPSDDEETKSSSTITEKKQETKNVTKPKSKIMQLSSSLQAGIDLSDIYVNVHSFEKPQVHKPQIDDLLLGGKDREILKKSVITPDFEKRDKVLPYAESVRKLKMQRRKERTMSKGNGWYNMPATELSDERKNDLKVLQMRHVLDPKRFYRANDIHAAPKYFQFGTVVESKADFYSSRIPKKQRKATLVDELFADAEFRRFNKRKYAEIQEAKRQGTGPYQRMRFPKKRKKTKK